MTEIKPLPESDFAAYAAIVANAYPGFPLESPEDLDRLHDTLLKRHAHPAVTVYGAYRDGDLLGGMVYYDFRLQLHNTRVLSGGVGMIAVDLLHKKEKVARDIMAHFVDHYAGRGSPLLMLYPFRPDFYKQMGFGYGAPKHEYRFKPGALRRDAPRTGLRFLTPDDAEAVRACYERTVDRTHGMCEKNDWELKRLMENPKIRVIGCERDGVLVGYLAFAFEKNPDNTYYNDLDIRELAADDRSARGALLTFLHTQLDQVREISYVTEDDTFHHALTDPRTASQVTDEDLLHVYRRSGLGLMYRVTGVPRLFAALAGHDFSGVTCRLRITLADSFYPPNAGSTVVHFSGGRPTVIEKGEAEVEIRLDVAEFSSLVMGVVPFRRLYDYGLADLSDPAYLATVDRLFAVADPPRCTTPF